MRARASLTVRFGASPASLAVERDDPDSPIHPMSPPAISIM